MAITSGAVSTVTVQPGLAFNRNGDAINLASSVDVYLVQPASAVTSNANNLPVNGTPSPFSQCGPPLTSGYVSLSGVFLLTIAPAYGTQGRALVNGLLDGADTCNAKYFVEGVQFRLIQLNFTSGELADNRLRSIVAAKCFGYSFDSLVDPFGKTPVSQGIIEDLRPSTLSNAEVPIAVISWTPSGITFVDMWSVRRRVSRADAADDGRFPIHGRDVARGEAMLLQFQDQLTSLMASVPNTIVATSVFQFLPPAGLIPLYSLTSTGFVQNTFFQGLTVNGPVAIEGARAQLLLRTALQYPPIDLSKQEMIWTLQTRQNMQQTGAVPFLFFASGQMPYFGESRYDVAYYDYASWT